MASSRTPTLGPSRAPTIVAVAVVLLLVVVVGGFLYARATDTPDTPAVSSVAAAYPTSVTDGVVVAGNGTRVVDVYEDVLCPGCRAFETTWGDRLTTALNEGRVQVRYHMVNLLDDASNPAGYSTLGGSALICAAENGGFATLHKTLYAQQPSEGGAGYTADQLVTLGEGAGAGPGYADCVRSGRYAPAVADNYAQASGDRSLQQTVNGRTGFGTPTVAVDGRAVAAGGPEFQAAVG